MTNDRKHITTREVEKLMTAAKGSRFEARDCCLLLMMFRHGLRVAELAPCNSIRWTPKAACCTSRGLKKGLSTTHPLCADELRVIKAWLADRAKMKATGKAFFVSQRRKSLNRRTEWLTIRKYGALAGLELPTHPHQLRHACGFALADQGADTRLIQDNPGHRDIRHTVIYTPINPARFERLWR